MATYKEKRSAAARWFACIEQERLPHIKTQSDLAREIGVSPDDISEWKNEPSFWTLVDKWSWFLNKTFGHIVMGRLRYLAAVTNDPKVLFDYVTKVMPMLDAAIERGHLNEVTGEVVSVEPDKEKVMQLLEQQPIEVRVLFAGLLRDLGKLPQVVETSGDNLLVNQDLSSVDYTAGGSELKGVKASRQYEALQAGNNTAFGDNLAVIRSDVAYKPDDIAALPGGKLSASSRERIARAQLARGKRGR